MSQVDARLFLDRMETDSELQRAAIAAMTALEKNGAATATSLVELGARHGMTFTPAELSAALKERHEAVGGEELSDARLEGVAGGTSTDMNQDLQFQLQQVTANATNAANAASSAAKKWFDVYNAIVKNMKS